MGKKTTAAKKPEVKTEDKSAIEAASTVGVQIPTSITLDDGREVAIHKCKVKHLGTVLLLVSDVINALGINDFQKAEAGAAKIEDPSFIMTLITEHIEQFARAVAMLTSLTDEEFEDLELDDAMVVVMAAYRVNESFLSSKVLPIVREKMARGKK
ncbi:MAG: hypothetical protein KAJ73_00310 [Zetaproteobacteria bacterium]|nr:hypothetical protein [Zetaproteobacteria bacterium]